MKPNEQELKQLRIIAVDDEESNLLLLRRILERDGYMRVDVTTDPSRVPGMFVESRPDLVLLDLHMPGMDGFELMDRLGPLTAAGSDVPFLVLTADATNETKRRALSVGARDLDRARLEVLERLALAAEYRDDNTQEHACGSVAAAPSWPSSSAFLSGRWS